MNYCCLFSQKYAIMRNIVGFCWRIFLLIGCITWQQYFSGLSELCRKAPRSCDCNFVLTYWIQISQYGPPLGLLWMLREIFFVCQFNFFWVFWGVYLMVVLVLFPLFCMLVWFLLLLDLLLILYCVIEHTNYKIWTYWLQIWTFWFQNMDIHQ